MCDVVGKGLESSFTTIQVHSIFHSRISLIDSPKNILSKLNSSIYKLRTEKNHCATFYFELNPLTKKIKYGDAGNGLCYLVRNDDLIHLNDFGGMVLGACENSMYTEGEIDLQKDDLLFLSTDGLIDFKNENNERFGISRVESLIKELPSQAYKKEYILNQINAFKNPEKALPDDITWFLLTVTNVNEKVLTAASNVNHVTA